MNGIFANYFWTTVLGKRILNILNHVIFPAKNTNIDVSVFMVDLRMINMSSECEYNWYWKISACSTEYEVCDSFALLTRQQTSYSGSAGCYFRYQSIHIQITYTYPDKWYKQELPLILIIVSFSRDSHLIGQGSKQTPGTYCSRKLMYLFCN